MAAMLAGWGRADQRDLTQRYEDGYLARLTDWWTDRTIENARRLVRSLFPPARDALPDVPADRHPTVRAVGAWLVENPDAAPALRRLVVEERDHLARTLRAQAAVGD